MMMHNRNTLPKVYKINAGLYGGQGRRPNYSKDIRRRLKGRGETMTLTKAPFRGGIKTGDWLVYVDLNRAGTALAVRAFNERKKPRNQQQGMNLKEMRRWFRGSTLIDEKAVIEFCYKDSPKELKEEIEFFNGDESEWGEIEHPGFYNMLEHTYIIVRKPKTPHIGSFMVVG